jgi:histidinol-phosphate aminotransferase
MKGNGMLFLFNKHRIFNNIMDPLNPIEQLVRPTIRAMKPYSSARDEFKGSASTWLDANENSFGSPLPTPYHRYPDPMQWKVKDRLSQIKGVPPEHIFLGNGSDEAIDLLFRAFCEPGIDNVILVPPTYGMYEVSAHINHIAIKEVPLNSAFQLDLDAIAEAIDEHTKLIFLCSPNNPTGNSLHREDIEVILNHFKGIVVIDEAYINYSQKRSFVQELTEYSHLVVLQTLSKAWGMAALRLGMAFSSLPIIEVLNKIKPPYNINQATQDLVLQGLERLDEVNAWTKQTVEERSHLVQQLAALPSVLHIYPSDANFILVKTTDANSLYRHLVDGGIVVRNRSQVRLCEGCLRVTVGTPEENKILIAQWASWKA